MGEHVSIGDVVAALAVLAWVAGLGKLLWVMAREQWEGLNDALKHLHRAGVDLNRDKTDG